ncbi:hypothetical protein SDRG_15701 [Saprolegnia diclina VS20]|uniref:Beta-amylase n=1 Tax=Saprolegnia diclina (strain VS20) TaxID=1156394 RepID=T0PW80_SAPDV|nr:hypothetical protein SDRG_15701 [Saprolegnia diclina VS20]EQC26456.1 hypothetical protein SDRG_15701 [Saprolegnia diclina VS20]|eukprot:XP_008620102.1 hypothetical protein SDRG_15701 [Saprolegnia diclina VS20]
MVRLVPSLVAAALALVAAEVPVNVMLPLDTVVLDAKACSSTRLKNATALGLQFEKLKASGATGVMADCWWGLVEGAGPRQYDFAAYADLARLAKASNLTIQMVMSFHQCGGNVGDECDIPIPRHWFTKDDVWYTTQAGLITKEYISLWADATPLDKFGRTPLQMYSEFLAAFKTHVVDAYPGVVSEVQIGGGPAGELRYPSYQLQENRWSYCGVGEFTSYDTYANASIVAHAASTGHALWATRPGPSNAGNFNCLPSENGQCPFFANGADNFASPYGQFYLDWYSGSLLQHGRDLTKLGRDVFPAPFELSVKVSGIHWWYDSPHHGAELTAGYQNTNNKNAYYDIASMLKEHDVRFCFTCMEMNDNYDDNDKCRSRPGKLVGQARDAVTALGLSLKHSFAGENALPIGGNDQITSIAGHIAGAASFTFLRLTDTFDFDYLGRLVQRLKTV